MSDQTIRSFQELREHVERASIQVTHPETGVSLEYVATPVVLRAIDELEEAGAAALRQLEPEKEKEKDHARLAKPERNVEALPNAPATETARDYGAPLDVTIELDALVIRIGIETLAHAVTYSDWANRWNDEADDYIREFAITDAREFAKDVMHAMEHEAEDGSSPLTHFIDKASEDAVGDGSLGLHEDVNHKIKHGEKSPLETW